MKCQQLGAAGSLHSPNGKFQDQYLPCATFPAQHKLFSKLPRHQNEMLAEYGLAAPVVSANILVELYMYKPYII